jgi:phospholipid/cholesterol/gamma-HCH transport system permease protein
MGGSWLAVPRDWIESLGDIVRFCARVVAHVFTLRVFRFFGEALRQSGILILGSGLVIWGLAFILGLTCGIEGAYFNRSVGAPAYAGVFSAWCDLREVMPYAFGYMMSAKVGTGLVAEIGAMRISDEIDALEVMGINSMVFLCATRLLAAWLVLPFMYVTAIGFGFLASYIAPKPVARPCSPAAVVYSPAVSPVSAQAVRDSGSISSPFISERSITTPSSTTP